MSTAPKLKSVKAAKTIPDIKMQDASLDIWDKKYRLKDKQEQPVDIDINATYERVAKALSDVEDKDKRVEWKKRFVWALKHGAIPAGRIISNAGAQAYKPATSTINCTVSGIVPDSMQGILERNLEAGLTLKAGCGIGYEFSTLRPKGAYVSGAGAYTSGPLSFMDIYDKMCFTVSSAGGRRGAQMATFDVSHPDVFDFVRAKREDGRLRQFNLSLLITEEFIEAVRADSTWDLTFPISAKEIEGGLDLKGDNVVWKHFPTTEAYTTNKDGLVACRIYETIRAQKLWNAIMSSTYDYAEPGFILIDQNKARLCIVVGRRHDRVPQFLCANGFIDTTGNQTIFVSGVGFCCREVLPDYIITFKVESAFDFFSTDREGQIPGAVGANCFNKFFGDQ